MGLDVCGTPGPASCRMRGRGSPRRCIEALVCGCYDRFGSETKILEQQAPSRAGSVVVDADDPAGVTDEITPTDADSGLYRDTRFDLGRDHGVSIAQILRVEPLPTGHRNNSSCNILLGEQLLGFN